MPATRRALTLIEMLVATAITLLMMAAVVNLFANLSGSIRNRRAVIELSGQLRQVRQRLALDLAGATCPASTWQRPGDDFGYFEIVEGQATDLSPSSLLDNDPANGELDYAVSIIPRNNIFHDDDGDGEVDDAELQEHLSDGDSLVPGGLGDYDDILALTVQSKDEPFVIQHPIGPGQTVTVQSQYAEVCWFAVENPANGALGEPGLRSIYRRALIIAPQIDAIPGPADPTWFFQRYDVSAHYDTTRNAWVPNTLGDLTKRENRFYRSGPQSPLSPYPHAIASGGAGYKSPRVNFLRAANDEAPNSGDAEATAFIPQNTGNVTSYLVTEGGRYDDLPSVTVTENSATQPATARPVMAKISSAPPVWQVAQLTFGPAPLSIHRVGVPGDSVIVDRTGDDLMLTDALGFDVRVYDPGAPTFLNVNRNIVVEPSDPAWFLAFKDRLTPAADGAYVDMGWAPGYADEHPAAWYAGRPRPIFNQRHQAGWHPRFAYASGLFPFGEPSVYDTWSVHYESDGLDQDNIDGDKNLSTGFDEGTNGVDDAVPYADPSGTPVVAQRDGPDDVGERETAPPYDVALRGVQVRLRLYERSARQIRETSVTQSLVP